MKNSISKNQIGACVKIDARTGVKGVEIVEQISRRHHPMWIKAVIGLSQKDAIKLALQLIKAAQS